MAEETLQEAIQQEEDEDDRNYDLNINRTDEVIVQQLQRRVGRDTRITDCVQYFTVFRKFYQMSERETFPNMTTKTFKLYRGCTYVLCCLLQGSRTLQNYNPVRMRVELAGSVISFILMACLVRMSGGKLKSDATAQSQTRASKVFTKVKTAAQSMSPKNAFNKTLTKINSRGTSMQNAKEIDDRIRYYDRSYTYDVGQSLDEKMKSLANALKVIGHTHATNVNKYFEDLITVKDYPIVVEGSRLTRREQTTLLAPVVDNLPKLVEQGFMLLGQFKKTVLAPEENGSTKVDDISGLDESFPEPEELTFPASEYRLFLVNFDQIAAQNDPAVNLFSPQLVPSLTLYIEKRAVEELYDYHFLVYVFLAGKGIGSENFLKKGEFKNITKSSKNLNIGRELELLFAKRRHEKLQKKA